MTSICGRLLQFYDAAVTALIAELQKLLTSRMPAFAHDASDLAETVPENAPVPIPVRLGRVCRTCGCSEHDACAPACGWADEDLCTGCAGRR